MDNLKAKIHQLPKADLHNHLHLGVGIQYIHKKYSDTLLRIPKTYHGLGGMIDFIYNHVNKLLETSEDAIYFMDKSIQSAINDNVTYLEASVDINLVRYFENSIESLIKAVSDLKAKYKSNIDFSPDIGINKELALEQVYSDGIKCIESGVFNGIDLYGREHAQNLNSFLDIYKHAKKHKLKTKVHIGEFSSPETIEEAIDLLDPDEIQHGIKAADSHNTMALIKEKDIQLNICPQSNVSLGSVKNLTEHPIRKLYDQGIKITINSDDFLLFNASITKQCLELVEHNIFSFEEIKKILENSLVDS